MWERAKHGFPEQRGIGDGVYTGRWMYEANPLLASFVFWSMYDGPSVLFVWTSLILFSLLVQTNIIMPHLPSAEKRKCLKCLSHSGNSLCLTGAPRKEWTICLWGTNYRRSLALKKPWVDFVSDFTIGLGCFHGFEELGSFQTLVCDICDMAIVPWFYELALCCFSLIW